MTQGNPRATAQRTQAGFGGIKPAASYSSNKAGLKICWRSSAVRVHVAFLQLRTSRRNCCFIATKGHVVLNGCIQKDRKPRLAAHPPTSTHLASLGRARRRGNQFQNITANTANFSESRRNFWKTSEPTAKFHRQHTVWPVRSSQKSLISSSAKTEGGSLPLLQGKHVAFKAAQGLLWGIFTPLDRLKQKKNQKKQPCTM